MWKISDVIAWQSGVSHSTRAMISKNKNEVTSTVKGSASLQAMRLTKFDKGLYRTWRNF